MSTQSEKVARILAGLQQKLAAADPAEAWLILGDTLAELDELGPHSIDGRSWAELVKEFHEGLGYSTLSVGHLQKVRRVRNFLRKVLQSENLSFTDSEIAAAQVSALEVAERLYSLDQEQGRLAMLACIRDQRKFVDMRRIYHKYVEQNPDRLPKKQATWLRKRKASPWDDMILVEKIILSRPELFFGRSSAVLSWFRPSQESPFLNQTDVGFRVAGIGQDCTLGVELLGDVTVWMKEPASLLAKLDFQSSFFDMYWVFLRANAEKAMWLSEVMSEVKVNRVGLLELAEDRVSVRRRPELVRPVPDRRHMLAAKWYDHYNYKLFDYEKFHHEANTIKTPSIPNYSQPDSLDLTWSINLEKNTVK